jgi:predicted ATPase/DNA-binding SARP family transcriptional activator
MDTMQYGILGPLEVTRAGTPVHINGPKQRALLILMMLHANQVVSPDKVIEAMWGPEMSGREAGTLRVHIANLRKALEPGRQKGEEPDILVTLPAGYMLRVDDDAIDSQRFERLASEARRCLQDDPDHAAQLLNEALELWRGSALEDVFYDDFVQAEIQRLDEMRLTAVENLNEARLAMGEHADLIGELERQVAAHPFRERLWGQMMIALYRSGRQAEALVAHQRLSDILGQHGLVPGPGLKLLEDRILVNDPSLMTPTMSVGPHRSPPAERTRLIGRSQEIAQLQKRLEVTRLLTLTGSGGVGKTRLAQRLAWSLVDERVDVWWVELSGLSDPRMIPEQIAAAGGLSQGPNIETVDLLMRLVAGRDLVIILDGCEHLIEESASFVDRLLAEASGVRFIATTREPLQVDGEQVWRVSSLSVPDVTTPTDELDRYPSVELFLERTRARGGDIPQPALPAVAVICRRLDGIPLALELAAARTTTLSTAEISERLADRFSLLERSGRTGIARHRTLEAAIDWSFQLLDERGRRLLSRLAVFVSGFDKTAAQAVCAFHPLTAEEVEAGVERLFEKSLIEPASIGPDRRFRLTESIQAFAWDRLVDDPDQLLVRHRDWALSLAVEGGTQVLGDEGTWFPRLEAAHEDLRTAFDRSLRRGEVDAALRLVGSLGGYLAWRRTNEGLKWLEQAILAADRAPEAVRPSTRARALLAVGPFLCYHNRDEEGRRRLAEAAELYTMLGHSAGLMWVHIQQSYFSGSDDLDGTMIHGQAAADLAQEIADPLLLAYALTRLAEIKLSNLAHRDVEATSELDEVISLSEEALRYCEKRSNPYVASMTKIVLGHALSIQGRPKEGWTLVEEGVRGRNRFALAIPCAYEWVSAGHLASRLGHKDRSSALIRRGLESLNELGVMSASRLALVGAADVLRQSAPSVAGQILGAAECVEPLEYHVPVLFTETQVLERLRRELGSVELTQEMQRGARLDPGSAIELALAHI